MITRRGSMMFVLVCFSLCGKAQTEATLYFMKSLPQVSISNPAFVPAYDYSIGLPGISSAAATYTNNGFTYNDLVNHTNGTTVADLDGWKGSLTSRNYVTASAQTDLLRVGFRTSEKFYFQISSTARQYSRAMLPQQLTSLLVQQNDALLGTTAQFSPQVEGTAWVETGISAAYKVNSKITAGVRLKYLSGLINTTTVSSDMNITIGQDYSVNASADALLRTSGVYDALASGYSFSREFRHYMSNSGAAIDLGATWQVLPKLTVAASVVDIGKVRWKNNVIDYVMNRETANYQFEGIDPDKLVRGDENYLDDEAKKIRDRFDFQKIQGKAYSTWIPGRMNVSAAYSVSKTFSAGMLMATEKYRGRTSGGVTASISKSFGRVLSTTWSYTVSNRSANNFGTGISLNLQPFQFYIAGDNLLNYPFSRLASKDKNEYVNNTQVFSCRAGLNFVWGRVLNKSERKPDAVKKSKAPATKSYIRARQRN